MSCLPLGSWNSASLGTPSGTLKSVSQLNLSSVRWEARHFSIDSYAPLMEDGSWQLQGSPASRMCGASVLEKGRRQTIREIPYQAPGSDCECPAVHHCTEVRRMEGMGRTYKTLQQPNTFHFRVLPSLPFNVYQQLGSLEGRIIPLGNSTELGVENTFYEYQVLKGLKRLE